MTEFFDPRQTLHDVISGVVNEETASKILKALDESGAAIIMPTTSGKIPFRSYGENWNSMCLWSPDGFVFSTVFNGAAYDGERTLESGTPVWLHAVGKGKKFQDEFNAPRKAHG